VNSAINDSLFIDCPFLGFLWYRTMTKMPLQKLVQEETNGQLTCGHMTLKDKKNKILFNNKINIKTKIKKRNK